MTRRKLFVHAEARNGVAERPIQSLRTQIAAANVEGNPGETEVRGHLLHAGQCRSAMALAAVLRVDKEVKDEPNLGGPPRNPAEPHETEYRFGRVELDFVDVMIQRLPLLWQQATQLRPGEFLRLMFELPTRGDVVRSVGVTRGLCELVEVLRRHSYEDGHGDALCRLTLNMSGSRGH